MQWDASPNAGFSTVEPWLPVSADYTRRNVAVQSQDPASMLGFYLKMFWLRKKSAALASGDYRPLDVEGNCYVYLREHGSERKLVALNFSAEPSRVATGLTGVGRLALSTHSGRGGDVQLALIELDGHEGVIIDL